MSKLQRKVLAVMLTVSLAFSMTSVTALSAFADQLATGSVGQMSAQASNEKVVYDSVYGSFGGYALMYKQATYSVQYSDGTWGTWAGDVVDVVNSLGEVTLHTTPSEKKSDSIPGGWSDYKMAQLGDDDSECYVAGYAVVVNKSTGKWGVKSLDGTDLVECKYDQVIGKGSKLLVGVSSTKSKASAVFYSPDGAELGTLSVTPSKSEYTTSYTYIYALLKGDYVMVHGTSADGYDYSLYGKMGKDKVTSVTQQQYEDASTSAPSNVESRYKLKDGTAVSTFEDQGKAFVALDANGNKITRKGYTIGFPALHKPNGSYATHVYDNSVRHGSEDIWWAFDSKGKWGAIDSYGNVKVPFEYDAYFDAGEEGEKYAIVKTGNDWKFLEVSSGVFATDLSNATIASIADQKYKGKAVTPKVTVQMQTVKLTEGVDYTVSYQSNKGAGKATVTVTGKGNYSGSKQATFNIKKGTNPMKVKAVNKTYKAKKLKKAAKTFKAVKVVKKAAGKLTYKNVSKGKALKKFKVAKKTGKVKVPKGTKAGTYKLKIKVSAAGNKNYSKAAKTITCKVKVR